METWLFWGLAAAAIVAALIVVAQRSAMGAVVALAALSLVVGGIYMLLAAPVAAVIQIVLYAGVLLIVVLPVTLFLDPGREPIVEGEVTPGAGARRLGVVCVVVWLVQMAWAFAFLRGVNLPPAASLPERGVSALARALAGDQSGVALIVILLAIVTAIGVAALVRREVR